MTFCYIIGQSQSSFNGVEEQALKLLCSHRFHIGSLTVGEYMKDINEKYTENQFDWVVETTKDSSTYLLSIRKDAVNYAYWQVNMTSGIIDYVNNNKKLCEKYELNYDALLIVYANQIGSYINDDVIKASISTNPSNNMITFSSRNSDQPLKNPNEFMMGRQLLQRPSTPARIKKKGKIVVKIKINNEGDVVHAEFVPKGSTSLEGKLITFAIKHAFDAKYSTSDIEGLQIGQIVFEFKGALNKN